jgi:hypothetical protein
MSNKNSSAWDKTIQKMHNDNVSEDIIEQLKKDEMIKAYDEIAEETGKNWDDEPNPIQDMKDAGLHELLPAKDNPKVIVIGHPKAPSIDSMTAELCKCQTKTPDWKHHQKYCPVWKNGRIDELENSLCKAHKILKSERGVWR